ncbi:MAG TPA: beta galactosidase jelly roll domain-containing protein [Bacteroidota bacterium]|nr:beta galactosidase jelly roll domain-containing protein [Bacteroidota bacterium]
MKAAILLFCFLVVTSLCGSAAAQDWRLLLGLRGDWKFEIGDDARRASREFDDSKWETIYAPATWEDEGFPGYDGYAWYRKRFFAHEDWKNKALYLRLGRIDDVDEVFVNGKRVGATGRFPPQYETAYNLERDYLLPLSFLNIPGENVIAVRVYDDQLEGGIVDGRLGVYEDRDAFVPDVPLAGEWKFSTGDNPAWKSPDFDDSKWTTIPVPAFWEWHGFSEYDGYAWYRVTFRVPAPYSQQRMILLLGLIDDFDETYLNGVQIGKTGVMGKSVLNTHEYQTMRVYTIPTGLLRTDHVNTIAVRVYDGFRDGGIYKGPIGLVTRDRYRKWSDKRKSDLEKVFEWLWR